MKNQIEPTKIVFQPEDAMWLMTLALRRDENKGANSKGKLDTTKTSFGVDVLGVFGEMAVAKVHGGTMDREIRRAGDGGKPDCNLRDGRRVEVKATPYVKYGKPKLTLNLDEVEKADHFCLVAVQLPDIAHVYPVLTKEEFLAHCYDDDFGHGARKVYKYNR